MTTPSDPLYASQWHFGLIGDIETIWDEYTGSGVHVGVYDDGIDLTHEDLAPNYDPTRHVLDGALVPIIPVHNASGRHGTATAGIIGAASNLVGGVGVSYGVSLTAVNIFNSSLYGYVNAANTAGFMDVVHQGAALFDISSNSWGASPVFFYSLADGGFADVLEDNYSFISASGRGGLGTVIVQAAGNNNLDGNGDGVNASRFTITVSATEQTGIVASYSNFGAEILVAAPAASVTTDITGGAGYDPTNYTTGFNGTSAATPVVSGVVALMLQANAGLGWRDVQNILAMSATLTGSAFNAGTPSVTEDGLWQANNSAFWNGGGNHIHTDYGYGMVNAYNAVRMAEVWNLFGASATSANEQHATNLNDFADVSLNTSAFSTTFTIVETIAVDHVALTLDLATTWIGDLRLTLTSADGTVITLARGDGNLSYDLNGKWVWGVDGLRGELSAGVWTLSASDTDTSADPIALRNAQLDVYGSAGSINNTYHFTSEYLAMRGFDASRGTVSDTNGGTDWLNLAAVSGNVAIDLTNGSTFGVNGVNWATLAGDFENIVTGDGNDTITGNDLDNVIHGMRGNDLLQGGGNAVDGGAGDTLYGGAGNDTLAGGRNKDDAYGGAGSDVFVQEDGFFADNVYGGGGNDTLDLSLFAGEAFVVDLLLNTYRIEPNIYGPNGSYDLFDVENVLGSQLNDKITGNNLVNLLSGGDGSDSLNGAAGNDTLNGGIGNDTLNGGSGFDSLIGGTGNDWYFVDSLFDIIEETAGDLLDRVLASVSFTLAADDNIEQMTTTQASGTTTINLIGNSVAQTIIGNAGINSLNGGGGNDTIIGGAGNDTLTGGTGNDLLAGGADNDWYYVDSLADIIDESAGNGAQDRVLASASFALAADDNIEQLSTALASGITTISLTGNALAQTITGNAGMNVLNGLDGADTLVGLAGADTLNGGTGVDSMTGGADSDWYYVDNLADIIVETAGGGTADRVLASSTFVLAADDNIEQLTTIQASATTAINLTGNALAQTITGNAGVNVLNGGDGADTVNGLAGADTLNGGTGVDSLIGGADSDWYYVDNALDIIVETAGGGTADRALASVSFTLAADSDIEQMSTTSAAGLTAIDLTGNALLQSITGNNGANKLNGGLGNDTLTGNLGADQFIFNTGLGAANIDRITDYTVADDTIVLGGTIFTGLGASLAPTAFEENGTGVATLAASRIIYDNTTGKLFFDVDGLGGAAGQQFALVSAHILGLSASEFSLI